MTFSASMPKPSICCCAVMNVAFENGLFRAKSSNLSIWAFAPSADPVIAVSAARDCCCSVL